MTNNHPITPPPELVRQWWAEETYDPFGVAISRLAIQAARWGSDQELEACCELIGSAYVRDKVRTARRPKPLSLKELALEILGYPKDFWSQEEVDTIRRALEQLDD